MTWLLGSATGPVDWKGETPVDEKAERNAKTVLMPYENLNLVVDVLHLG